LPVIAFFSVLNGYNVARAGRRLKPVGVKPFKLLSLPRFRAAYDFLLLRAQTGDVDIELAEWWTRFQAVGEVEQKKMTRPPRKYKKNRKKRDVTKQDSTVNSQNE
jgi:poly(A) polymerase